MCTTEGLQRWYRDTTRCSSPNSPMLSATDAAAAASGVCAPCAAAAAAAGLIAAAADHAELGLPNPFGLSPPPLLMVLADPLLWPAGGCTVAGLCAWASGAAPCPQCARSDSRRSRRARDAGDRRGSAFSSRDSSTSRSNTSRMSTPASAKKLAASGVFRQCDSFSRRVDRSLQEPGSRRPGKPDALCAFALARAPRQATEPVAALASIWV
mmetsp:Transcript_5850/g.14559  ORF Transcript_5850/g.14559 Transcript_5850/m.14559 type:complete len:211 (+) Transcript_5850:1349-1981(+)